MPCVGRRCDTYGDKKPPVLCSVGRRAFKGQAKLPLIWMFAQTQQFSDGYAKECVASAGD